MARNTTELDFTSIRFSLRRLEANKWEGVDFEVVIEEVPQTKQAAAPAASELQVTHA